MEVEAFSPGHVTGFFFPARHSDPVRSGSRGAGVSIAIGARTTVRSMEGAGDVKVRINGQVSQAPVTECAARKLLGSLALDLEIDTRLDMPVSQGLGASAAGSLSAALAVAEIVGAGRQRAFEAAHCAEVTNHTGLGDVPGIYGGGFEFRVKEGLPPHGEVDRFGGGMELIIAVVGERVRTADVLGNAARMRVVEEAGRECVAAFAGRRDVPSFFALSRRFMERSGLATPEAEAALAAIDGLGMGSMSMLGNTIFAAGDVDAMERALSPLGDTRRCMVDLHGARVLSVSR
jgi:pantoate kinase